MTKTAKNKRSTLTPGSTKGATPDSAGLASLIFAYTIWGISPLYWKTLAEVPALELLFHRTVWSFFFLGAILIVQKKTGEVFEILSKPRILASLFLSTTLLGCNWFVFIWAVNNGQVLQTSLGYFINPLVMVILGVLFLGERLTPLKWLALLLATSGVLYYALGLGTFPWIALVLAGCFGFYGLFHKMTRVTAVTGICVETMLLTLPAGGYLVWLNMVERGTMFNVSSGTDLLLIGTTLVTALPLVFFTLGAKRVTLATVGFMQYLAPTLSFMLAVFVFDEPFSKKQLVTFAMIWVALALYSADTLFRLKKAQRYLKL